jgi:hypothetical protein
MHLPQKELQDVCLKQEKCGHEPADIIIRVITNLKRIIIINPGKTKMILRNRRLYFHKKHKQAINKDSTQAAI